jgi:hypothetical protein
MTRLLLIFMGLMIALRVQAQVVWAPLTDKANIYPSERAAVEAMVDSFAAKLNASPGFHETGLVINLAKMDSGESGILPPSAGGSYAMPNQSGSSGPEITDAATDQAIQTASARLQLQFHNANISVSETRLPRIDRSVRLNIGSQANVEITQSEGAQPGVTIGIALGDVENFSSPTASGYRGRLRGMLDQNGAKTIFDTKFIDTPWVDDWASFENTQPSGIWVAGRSTDPCLSVEEAEKRAFQDAAGQIADRWVAIQRGSYGYISPEAAKGLLANLLRTNSNVDRFAQRIDRFSGPLWRVAVLVPATDGYLAQIPFPGLSVSRRSGSTLGREFAEVLALALVIFLLYLVLNAVTKGYFTWQLRMGVVAIVLIAMFMFVAVLFFVRGSVSPMPMVTH